MIEIVFSDLTFEVTVPQPPPGYKTMTSKERRKADEDRRNQIALQHRQKIKHPAVHHSFIYEYDVRNRMLIKKFHGPYIVNAIAVLFTGPNARIPAAMEDKRLSTPLLAAICTLVCFSEVWPRFFCYDFHTSPLSPLAPVSCHRLCRQEVHRD